MPWKAERAAAIERWKEAGKHIPSQTEIAEFADFLSDATARGEASAMLERIQLPPGIGVTEFSEDLVMVYWEGDPLARALVNAGIKELPVLLTCENALISAVAKQRLDMLLARGGI